ncbi:MAG: CAP domain-containing protein [Acidimicrobiia bacterium]
MSLVLVALSFFALAPVAAADTETEAEFLSEINATRAAHGLGALHLDDALRSHARSHSEDMAQAGEIYHSSEAELTAAAGTGWSGIAENVGQGKSASSLHDAFMASPGHKSNILGDYNYVGIGTDTSGGYLYVTVVFVGRGDSTATDSPTDAIASETSGYNGTFADDEGNIHEPNIEVIAAEGITLGCNPPENSLYCPDDSVTRGAMAAFIARALGLPAVNGDHFNDDDASTFENAINRVAAAGITQGCNPPENSKFCPNRTMTRGEMAAFLVRAFDLPASATDYFGDDRGHIFEDAINRLGAAGITLGCNPPENSKFCPDDPIRRDQMATFLVRAST